MPEKKLGGNYIRMPRIVLNKSWKQHPYEIAAVQPLTSHFTNQDEQNMQGTKDKLISIILINVSRSAKTYIHQLFGITGYHLGSYWEQWLIGMDGERKSSESMLSAHHDNNNKHE